MANYTVNVDDKRFQVELLRRDHSGLSFVINSKTYDVEISSCIEANPVIAQAHITVPNTPPPSSTKKKTAAQGQILAPMPGIVTKVLVKEGDNVNQGQALLMLEAMKMENSVNAPCSGKVKKVFVEAGKEVLGQQDLVHITPSDS